MKAKAIAKKVVDADALEHMEIPTGVLIDDPLPPEPPELIPGILLRHGATGIVGSKETGKAQPLDAKVLTSSGWSTIGALSEGDELVSPTGGTTSVLMLHPKKIRQVYRVTFSDGRSTEACADHLWEVYNPFTKKEKQKKVLSTRELLSLNPNTLKNIYINPPNLTGTKSKKLPIDPWLLGALIGDGSLSGSHVELTTADPELAERAVRACPEGTLLVRKPSGKYAYSFIQEYPDHDTTGGPTNLLKVHLRSLGLLGKKSYEKMIPQEYMIASRQDKENLLSGLIDTDGSIGNKGTIYYYTTSEVLARQVTDLVRSLGGICKTKTKTPTFVHNGVRKAGRLCYVLSIWYQEQERIVSLERKRALLVPHKETRRITFRSINPTRKVMTRCITVDNPNGLYITDDYVVTHNSLVALEIQQSLLTGAPLWGQITPTTVLDKTVHIIAEHTSSTLQGLYHRTQLPPTGRLHVFGPEHMGSMKLLVSNGSRREEAIAFYKKMVAGAGLVVFDPLAAFIQGESAENDNAPMRSLIDSMIEIAQSTNAACLVLCHKGKPAYFNGKEVRKTSYALRGASAAEDALTATHYLDREAGVTVDGKPAFRLEPTHYKGVKAKPFILLRDTKSCLHTLKG